MNANAVTLFGNAGGTPELRTIEGKSYTREVYDVIGDGVIERQFTSASRDFRTFSLAVSKTDGEGNKITRWIRCVDWKALSRHLHKGDRVKVRGYFKEHTYEKDGETKTVRDFIIEDLHIERIKQGPEIP